MTKIQRAIQGVLILAGISSCGAHLRDLASQKIQSEKQRVAVCGKVLDIPVYKAGHGLAGQEYIYWVFAKEKEKELGLYSAECIKDSILFRMHITGQNGMNNQAHALLEIRKDSSGLIGKLAFLEVDFDFANFKEKIGRKIITEVKPENSWSQVLDSLNLLKYQELKTDEEIQGYGNNPDLYAEGVITYSFEYSDEKKYRFYQYSGIFSKESMYEDVANAAKMVDLLIREFSIYSQGCQFFGCN